MSSVRWLITDQNITVNYDGQTHIVSRSDSLANKLIEAIKTSNYDEIPKLVSVAKRITNFSDGNFEVRDGKIFVNGVVAPAALSNRIMQFVNEGLPYQPLVKFAENIQKNPSYRAVNELFQFLEKNNHPITDNGCFIAYKKVRNDFKDAYSGTIDNSVGKIVEMPRNQVDEDPTRTCSNGLHVANWSYACNVYDAGENSIMLEVEVDPSNVVAVPVDYDNSKMRVCKYKILGIVDKENSDSPLRVTSSTDPVPSLSDYCEEYEDYDEEDCCVYCNEPECCCTDY